MFQSSPEHRMRETVFVSLRRNLRSMHAVAVGRRSERYARLPFLLYYSSAMYHNSQQNFFKVGIHRYRTLFKEYFNADKITRNVRDLLVSKESFHSFLRHHSLIRYRSTEHFRARRKPSFILFFLFSSIKIDLSI